MPNPVSLLIPSYNEGETLKKTIYFFRHHFPDLPLIVVDDGSTDDSFTHLQKITDAKLQIYALTTNQGKSSAVSYGLKKVTTPWVCLFDADLSNLEPAQIRHFLNCVNQTTQDMIVCAQENDPWLWRQLHLHILLSGERCIKTKVLRDFFAAKRPTEYQIEMALHYWFLDQQKSFDVVPMTSRNKLKIMKWSLPVAFKKIWRLNTYLYSKKGFGGIWRLWSELKKQQELIS